MNRKEAFSRAAGCVDELRKSFEEKHSDICQNTEALRECIVFYDLALFACATEPPETGEDMDDIMSRCLDFLPLFCPIVRQKMENRINEIRKFFPVGRSRTLKLSVEQVKALFPDHPILKVGIELEGSYFLEDYLLISRNFLAVYIGDPVKVPENFHIRLKSAN
jgi:hypothetical protein